jgi:hypothetical protein
MAIRQNIDLMKTPSVVAQRGPLLTMKLREVQIYPVRIVMMGRKIMSGLRARWAHRQNGAPNFGRQSIDMLSVPWRVYRAKPGEPLTSIERPTTAVPMCRPEIMPNVHGMDHDHSPTGSRYHALCLSASGTRNGRPQNGAPRRPLFPL